MTDLSQAKKASSLSALLILTGLCILGIVVFSSVGFLLAGFITGLETGKIQSLMVDFESTPNARIALLVLQGTIALGGFVILPSLVRFLQKQEFSGKIPVSPSITMLIMIFSLAILMMPVNGWLSAINKSIHLPSFLSEVENWAQAKETEIEKMTFFLVDFQSITELVVGFIVISLIAGFTEEFFFRKLIQPRMYGLTGNIHLAVWLTAFLFSAIHFQFFGLVPRMVLGALFGYYFYWTGNIWLSVFGHSLNNGLTLVGLYLYKQNLSPIDVEDPEQIPWYIGAVAAGVTWSLATMVKDESDKIRKRNRNQAFVNQVIAD
jgi:membrane protease YdiL (CAAX protease family)